MREATTRLLRRITGLSKTYLYPSFSVLLRNYIEPMYDVMLYENDGESSKLLDFLLYCNGTGNPLPKRKGNSEGFKTEPKNSEAMIEKENQNVDSSTTTETTEAPIDEAVHSPSKGTFLSRYLSFKIYVTCCDIGQNDTIAKNRINSLFQLVIKRS